MHHPPSPGAVRHRLSGLLLATLFSLLPLQRGLALIDPLDHWHWRSTLPTSHGVRSIAKGDGILVAVADGPTFLRSTDDGLSWEVITVTSPLLITSQLFDIAHGNGTFVAAGNNDQLYTSPDGQTWTMRSAGEGGSSFRSVAFDGSTFVIAGADSATETSAVLFSSPDGVAWTPRTTEVSGPVNELVFENSEFIACGGSGADSGFVITSPDGTTWTTLVDDLPVTPASVTHGLGAYFTITPGFPSFIHTSSDGTTWTGGPNNSLQSHPQIRFFNGELVSFDRGNFFPQSTYRTSSDGTTWSPASMVTKAHGMKVVDGLLYSLSGPEILTRQDPAAIFRTSDVDEWTALHSGWHQVVDLKAVTGSPSGFRVAGPDRAAEYGASWKSNLFLFDFQPRALLDDGGTTYSAGLTGIHSSTDGRNYNQLAFTSMNDITWGAGVYVTCGNEGNFSYSSDGSSWPGVFTGFTDDYLGVTFGDGLFVAVGEDGAVATSGDGMSWSPATSGQSGRFTSVAHGAGTFVAVGDGGAVMSSTNGTSWTARTSGTEFSLTRVRHLDGKFRAIGKGGTLIESTDGTSWSPVALPQCLDLCDIAWDGSRFLIVGQASQLLWSDDGTSWSPGNLQPGGDYGETESIVCAGGGFLASGDTGGMKRSPTGKSWFYDQSDSDIEFCRIYDFVEHEGTIVGVGERDGADSVIWSSCDNGATWASYNLGFLGSFEGVTYGDGIYVAVGENVGGNSVIASSPDAKTWTLRTSGTFSNFLDVAHGNGIFVAVNATREVVTSPDGITWTARPNASPGVLNAITFAEGKFVAGSTEMHTSTDGITWTMTDTIVGGANGIAYGAGHFVAVCNGGYIHTSDNGSDWIQRPSPTFQRLWDVAYGNDSFVVVGVTGTILQSDFLASSPPSIDWLSPAFVLDGGDYALSVTAKGRAPFAYQWFKDDVAIPGANDYLLSLPGDGDNAGNYHVVVSNGFGQVTSDPVSFVAIEPEFRLEILSVDLDAPEIRLEINVPPGQFYDLYFYPIAPPDVVLPGPREWSYYDSIFVDGPDQIYTDSIDIPGVTGRLYQLRESGF